MTATKSAAAKAPAKPKATATKKAAAPTNGAEKPAERVIVTLRYDREGPHAFMTDTSEKNTDIPVESWGLRAAMREVTGWMIENGWTPVERNWMPTTNYGESIEGHGEVERSFRR